MKELGMSLALADQIWT